MGLIAGQAFYNLYLRLELDLSPDLTHDFPVSNLRMKAESKVRKNPELVLLAQEKLVY